MHGFIVFFNELFNLLTINNILILSVSTVAGITIGALPGLTATMGIALLSGLTYGMSTNVALLVLMGIYVGAIYGGSVSAVLIGIPGTGSAAATVLDGYPLAKAGKGGRALTLTTLASFIGTLFGMLLLVTIAPLLQSIALSFSSPEFALLAIFGVMICGSLTAPGAVVKGWIAGFIGLAASTIGFEQIYAYPRFTYGLTGLLSGIAFVPAMIGMFGIPSILIELSHKGKTQSVAVVGRDRGFSIFSMLRKYFPTIIRSGLIGTAIGAIPGVGEDIGAWISYDQAKKYSKHPEDFGKGSYEGIIAAETGNNAAIGGALIPLLSLAIPGSAPTAVLLGALWLHDVRPGPMLTFEFPNFIYFMAAILFLASFTMRIFGVLACKVAPKLLSTPINILMPAVAVFSVIGSYALNINIFDLYVMFIFGILGYLMDRMKYPAAPVVLGIILGPIADQNIRRALLVSEGSLSIFFTRPISIVLLILIFFSVFSQLGIKDKIKSRIKNKVKNN